MPSAKKNDLDPAVQHSPEQPQEGLVHNRRGLQSVAAAFRAHIVAGQSPQFVVYQRSQTIQRLRMPRSPSVSSCVKLAGTCIVAFSPPTKFLAAGSGFP